MSKYFALLITSIFVSIAPLQAKSYKCIEAYKERYGGLSDDSKGIFSSEASDKQRLARVIGEWEVFCSTGRRGEETSTLLKRLKFQYPDQLSQLRPETFGQMVYGFAKRGFLCSKVDRNVVPLVGASDLLDQFFTYLSHYSVAINEWISHSGDMLGQVNQLEEDFHQHVNESIALGATRSRAIRDFQSRNYRKFRRLSAKINLKLKEHFDQYYFLKPYSFVTIDYGYFENLSKASRKIQRMQKKIEDDRNVWLANDYGGSVKVLKKQLGVSNLNNRLKTSWLEAPEFIRSLFSESGDCVACCQTISTDKPIRCSKCHLLLCRSCFVDYFLGAVQEGIVPVKCTDRSCAGVLEFNEVSIKFTFPAEILNKWSEGVLAKEIEDRGEHGRCPVPNCHGYIAKGKREPCEFCGFIDFCPVCMQDADPSKKHRILSEEEEENYGKLFSSGVMKKCPRCRIKIEKNRGCLHMTCKKCSFEFNWKTLAAWDNVRGFINGPERFSKLEDSDIFCEGLQQE